jgi:hypothetical protein
MIRGAASGNTEVQPSLFATSQRSTERRSKELLTSQYQQIHLFQRQGTHRTSTGTHTNQTKED